MALMSLFRKSSPGCSDCVRWQGLGREVAEGVSVDVDSVITSNTLNPDPTRAHESSFTLKECT